MSEIILSSFIGLKNKIKIIFKIIYFKKDYGKVRIFGKNFVKRNKDKCKIIYNNKEYELTEYFNDIDEDFNSEIKIKLKGINNISNMSCMFYECKSLSSLPDISKWNTSNVTYMSRMFDGCNSLSSLPDISKWNTSNVTKMSLMFDGCSSLSSLPNISKWNTSHVEDMLGMFSGCKKELVIP